MKTRRWVGCALAAALMVAGAAAQAQHQGFGQGGPRGEQRGDGGYASRDMGPPGQSRGAYRHPSQRDYRHGYRPGSPRHAGPRYAPPPPPRYGYSHGYPSPRVGVYPGGYLPPAYRHRYYVVDQWRGYPRLTPPPRGYHWVQIGGDFALVAIASGIIASIIMAN
ncbi:MAG: hypothetical protein GAK30_01890 [Paracidovorax wautersii]|uniref:Regulator RcnB of Ni and Co efflux n=1 Tax=Paracidovorax wautersii TaxID=1177982 RepID=A0A7V8JQB4_9BURK|nr:MAG: hypothetical protein GAK30_01890 [Paracidovorax wautersii]